MKKLIKRNFTLLELMLTIALIAISFSIIGLNTNKAIYKHRYKSYFKKIDMYFDFCKTMSFSNQADVYLKITQNGQDVYYEIGTDEKVGFFENASILKDSFKDMFFLFNNLKVNDLEIIFSSTGKIVPSGEIKFFDKKNKFEQNKTI